MKLLVKEQGTDWAALLWEGPEQKCVSVVAYAEVRAALAAANRAGRIDSRFLEISKRNFDRLWEELTVVNPDFQLVRDSGELAELHSLGGFDAIHLASAISIEQDEFEVLMATWDKDLAIAACDEGINTVRATRD